MATVVATKAQKPGLPPPSAIPSTHVSPLAVAVKKPRRSRSSKSQLRLTAAAARKPDKKAPEPFDIDELCRRLKIQELRQQEREERRRRRAQEHQERQGQMAQQYHHTPRVAALDFTRTATPDLMGKKDAHRLSRAVLDRYKHGLGARDPAHPEQVTAGNLADALEAARLEMERVADRNHFQRNRDLEDAAQRDKERDINKPTKKDFEPSPHHPPVHNESKHQRSFSVGGAEWEHIKGPLPVSKATSKPGPQWEDHHDWAQRDEHLADRRRSLMDRVSPFLRKTESVWLLKHKKERPAKDASLKEPITAHSLPTRFRRKD